MNANITTAAAAKFVACIPTQPNGLYSSFGVDILEACDPAADEWDTTPVEWIAGGEFPLDEDGESILAHDFAALRAAADELAQANGWRIDWDSNDWEDTGDYLEFPAERA